MSTRGLWLAVCKWVRTGVQNCGGINNLAAGPGFYYTPSQTARAASDRSRTQRAVTSRAHKPSHAGTRRDWTRRNGYHTSSCRENRDKTWQNAAERDKTWKDREMPVNTHASRPTTDRLQVLLRPLTYCHVLLRSPRFTTAYTRFVIRTVTAVANFLTV